VSSGSIVGELPLSDESCDRLWFEEVVIDVREEANGEGSALDRAFIDGVPCTAGPAGSAEKTGSLFTGICFCGNDKSAAKESAHLQKKWQKNDARKKDVVCLYV